MPDPRERARLILGFAPADDDALIDALATRIVDVDVERFAAVTAANQLVDGLSPAVAFLEDLVLAIGTVELVRVPPREGVRAGFIRGHELSELLKAHVDTLKRAANVSPDEVRASTPSLAAIAKGGP